MKAGCRIVLVAGLARGVGGPLRAQAPQRRAAARRAAAAAATAPAPAQPPAEPFDLEKERQKAAGTFGRSKRGEDRRNPFENPLAAIAARPTVDILPAEEQARLATQAELSLGLYRQAVQRGEPASAKVHLKTIMDILSKMDEVTIGEYRQRLEEVSKGVDIVDGVAKQRFDELSEAFKAGEYERVLELYGELVKFPNALPESDRQRLAARLAEMEDLYQKAKTRLEFREISLVITGVVVGETASFATVNGRVLGQGDFVSKALTGGRMAGPLDVAEPMDPPVRAAEIRLGEVVFEYKGELFGRQVGREHLVRERQRSGGGPRTRVVPRAGR